MDADIGKPAPRGRVLLCFDRSDNASYAVARAAELLAPRDAVVLTVWEPASVWTPYDPATILDAAVSELASKSLGLDQIARDVASESLARGVALANEAGFTAEGRLASGKTWRAICDVAQEIDAAPIVLGSRGLSRVKSALLGSVSAAVVAHAAQPVLVVPPRSANSGRTARS